MKNGITVLDVTNDIPTIYVGYDSREDESYEVLKYTAKKYASGPINVYPIKQDLLRRVGLYRRERAYKTEIDTHQYYDIFHQAGLLLKGSRIFYFLVLVSLQSWH